MAAMVGAGYGGACPVSQRCPDTHTMLIACAFGHRVVVRLGLTWLWSRLWRLTKEWVGPAPGHFERRVSVGWPCGRHQRTARTHKPVTPFAGRTTWPVPPRLLLMQLLRWPPSPSVGSSRIARATCGAMSAVPPSAAWRRTRIQTPSRSQRGRTRIHAAAWPGAKEVWCFTLCGTRPSRIGSLLT